MAEALNPDPASYKSFNDFFTRELTLGARPSANAPWICPVDGAISQCGDIKGDQIFQAKGHSYSTSALLACTPSAAQGYADGQFATIYLSPRDYHRIHMPCAGTLRKMTYVPGDLYSVNPETARAIPGLFARNERVVCLFDTEHGPMAFVLVGATIVGSMATTWHGLVNPPRTSDIRIWEYSGQNAPQLAQGQEMGRFLLGSTVVLLFPKNALKLLPEWQAEKPVRMGEAMARN